MRFSLKALLILVLLVALSISAIIQFRSAARARARAADLRSTLHFYASTGASSQDHSREWERAKESESDLLAQHEQLIERLRKSLEKAAATIEVQPVNGKLSVLGLPRITDVLSFPRSWQVNVPDSANYELIVDFVDSALEAQTVAWDYNEQTPVAVPLEAGKSVIEADFRKADKDNPGLFRVKLNQELVIERVHLPGDYGGTSSRVLTFIKQRDFDPDTNIIELLHFGATPGKTKIRARIKRVAP